MKEIALHILDIAENSISAGARNISIDIHEDLTRDRLTITITDDGKGMDAAEIERVVDPFITSRTTRRVGLGIPLLKAAAEACQGELTIRSAPGKGTTLTVHFQHSHIDRMPLGDLPGTFLTLLIGYPNIHWTFRYRVNEQEFLFDDAPIKQELEGVPLTEPSILAFLRKILADGISRVQESRGE